MLAKLRSIFSCTRGNFGVLTGLIMVPLIGSVGLAIDFGRALEAKSYLDAAADAAVLAAVSEKSAAVAKAMKMAEDGTVAIADTEAKKIFKSQLSARYGDNMEGLSSLLIDVKLELVKSDGVVTSRLKYAATLPTTFTRILGNDEMAISGQATAAYLIPSFLDFYMLLDNTPSMGVGATADDVAKLEAATKNGSDGKGKDANCAFACHIVSTSGVADKNSYYYLAKEVGATIRIDVVAEAVSALMTTAQETQTVSGQFKIGAYTFGQTSADAQLYTVSEPTSNFTSVAKATKMIELMSVPSHSSPNGQTDYNEILSKIGQKIKTVGDGSSSADRQPIVFLVADGVGDAYRSDCTKKLSSSNGDRCMEPLNASHCNALKARGIKVAVLYTTYLPLPKDGFYKKWIAPFQKEIPTQMQSCATEGYYFEVSPTDGIGEAMDVLFRKIVGRVRLTS